jgi:hypothetical protein
MVLDGLTPINAPCEELSCAGGRVILCRVRLQARVAVPAG